jgi:sirohydrochlorin cobaltochelatase
MKKALVLFAHGARSQTWAAPFERLREQTQARLPQVRVVLAFLELMDPRLPETVDALVREGVDDVTVLPVFLGQGGHVLRDLPQLVEGMRAAHPGLHIEVVGAIGEDPDVQAAMTDYCVRALG